MKFVIEIVEKKKIPYVFSETGFHTQLKITRIPGYYRSGNIAEKVADRIGEVFTRLKLDTTVCVSPYYPKYPSTRDTRA